MGRQPVSRARNIAVSPAAGSGTASIRLRPPRAVPPGPSSRGTTAAPPGWSRAAEAPDVGRGAEARAQPLLLRRLTNRRRRSRSTPRTKENAPTGLERRAA